MKKIFVIDVMAMAFRTHYALASKQFSTSKQVPTSALYGSTVFLLKLLEEEKPDFLVLASDSEGKNFRHSLYPQYKGNRGEMPEALAQQIPHLFRLFSQWGLACIAIPGVEADDIVGSIARQWAEPGRSCYMVSGDKDFLQLVNEQVYLYVPKKGGLHETFGLAEVSARFGCAPSQVSDIMALWGDAVDNVPGVHGIGEKGAIKLIQTYGSLEQIYAQLDGIANKKHRQCLEAAKELAFLSRQLVTIKTDVPLPLNLSETRCDSAALLASPGLLAFCEEMEFSALSQRLRQRQAGLELPREELKLETSPKALPRGGKDQTPLASNPEPLVQSQAPASKHYRLIQTPESFKAFMEALKQAPYFSFDTETTGLDIVSDQPIGISFALDDQHIFYVPLLPKYLQDLKPDTILSELKEIFQDSRKRKIAHNLKFDLQMLKNIGLIPCPPFGDSMLLAFLLDSSQRGFGIDALSERYLGFSKIPTSALIGKKATVPMSEVALQSLTIYACEDADCCLQLHDKLYPELSPELVRLYEEVDMPLVPILADMEQAGIRVEGEALADISEKLLASLEGLIKEIFTLAGEEFNINSPKQLQAILYNKLAIPEKLGIKRLKKTKNGYSTDVSVLETLSGHPLPAKILAYRTLAKLKNTYVDTLPQLIHEKTQRIHTSFHQTGTATGRLSSSHPNLQNIPIRSEEGREIRTAFRARPGWLVLSADYSQIELRLLAHMADDAALIAAFKADEDIHTATAATILKKAPEEITANDRAKAKAINYGIIYGMGAQRLARATGVSTKEAKEFIERYFASFPGIERFIAKAIAFAEETGFSCTLMGRRRAIEGLDGRLGELAKANARNMAVNSPIQGSAADLMKLAMINIKRKLDAEGLQAKMLLQVHDELVFECPPAEKQALCQIVKEGMENAMNLRIQLKTEIGCGANWLEAH